MLKIILVTFFLALTNAAGAVDQHGSPEEAMAMVKKTIAYMKANGKQKGIDEVNDPNGQFVDRDLYITVIDLEGISLANPNKQNKKMIGKNLLELKDSDGKYFVKERLELANSKGSGWINYRWINPVTKNLEMKALYVEKFENITVGCGVYK